MHGMGTNSSIFESQLGPISSQLETHGHEFIFVDGQVECDTASDIAAYFPGPYLCYYNMPTHDQVKQAHEFIKDVMDEEGPFDGVIAFSQGAALASSLLLEHAKSKSHVDLLKLGIFIGASLPFDLDNQTGLLQWLSARSGNTQKGSRALNSEFDGELGAEEPHGFPAAPELATQPLLGRFHPDRNPDARIRVPTLHIIGDQDQYSGQSRMLAKMCGAESTIVRHGEGHRIPRDGEFQRKALMAMERIIQRVGFRH